MIARKELRKERCKQAPRANKPKSNWFINDGDPMGAAAYALRNKHRKHKKR